jgi:serine/threonine-protein kinase SRPK3
MSVGANLNSCHCLQMMNSFKLEGPHGKHIGMVFEIMGVDLLKVMKWYDWEGIPLPIVRLIAK